MHLDSITPLIITYNEEVNIGRVLDRLLWASQILVIDSFSTDGTLDILKMYPRVRILQHPFDSLAGQCNFGLSEVTTEWTLSLDADYVLSSGLLDEIRALPDSPSEDGFHIPFQYCVFGSPLRGTLLPPRTALYRSHKATYRNDGHAHRVVIDGFVGRLHHPIAHDDRKPLGRWLASQDRYMLLEVQKLSSAPFYSLSFGDKVRKTKTLAPFMVLVYCLILKGGILDGWPGWYYALQRCLAEILLAIRLIEHDIGSD